LCAAQKILRELKSKISSQSKKNFVLEKDVRYLDSRIALLIQNRMALEEVRPDLRLPERLLTSAAK
jgi:Ras GTPase-activating-like protein IQGAP2/3